MDSTAAAVSKRYSMELQSIDSKKLFKVFDASKRKRKKKREGLDDTNSVATDNSNSGCAAHVGRMSGKASLQDMQAENTGDGHLISESVRERGSSPSIPREGRSHRSHRRSARDGLSLALKAGKVSNPRTDSPPQDGDPDPEHPTQDNDSVIYAFLEEAIKRDKKKHRHGDHRQEEHRSSHDRETSEPREHRRRHRRREGPSSREHKPCKEYCTSPVVDQTVLLETFTKLYAQMNEKNPSNNNSSLVQRTQSHKSLQCEVASRRNVYEGDHRTELANHENLRDNDNVSRRRSQGNCCQTRSREKLESKSRHEKCSCFYDKNPKYDDKLDYANETKYPPQIDYNEPKYSSKIDVNRSRAVVNGRIHEEERYRGGYPPDAVATRTCIDHRERPRDNRDYRDYDRKNYEDDRRRYVEQKSSRSFEVRHDKYEEERCRRTSRSETKDKRYDSKYYEKPILEAPDRYFPSKERRARRISERFDRNSIVSREDEFRERDRFSERERDSGLSVADGETSTISGRSGKSNYMRVVKQEIAEQRDAMDKMMKLWKELMRCFKGISQMKDKDQSMNENACENARDSAAAQLRLWRECMRRYETVARDVGDTDARLMEEINKQRSEMSEMATMWQECLQRYRDMSNDFNTLKQQLATAESPTRLPAAAPVPPAQPLVCAEGEGSVPVPQYRLPHNYPPLGPTPSPYPCGGSPLRGRASAPPDWWWGGARPSPRQRSSRRSSRRSSPASRDGRTDRDRKHRNKDARDTPRYKDKSSKANAARSDHRRRKR